MQITLYCDDLRGYFRIFFFVYAQNCYEYEMNNKENNLCISFINAIGGPEENVFLAGEVL